jgi:hypothetical protein
MSHDFANLSTRTLARTFIGDDSPNLIERESQDLRTLDEIKAGEYIRVIQSVPALRARRLVQQATLFIEAERLDANPAGLRYLAYLERVAG